MNNPKTAIVTGATGLIGKHLVEFLLEDSFYSKVKVLVRNPLEMNHSKLESHSINFNELASYQDIAQADMAFCCLGTTRKKAGSKEGVYKVDFTYVLEFAKLASKAGAKHFFLVSAMGANAESSIHYNQVKGEIESAVQQIPFDSVHIFRPSLLMGERNEKRLAEDMGQKLSKYLNPILPNKYKSIEGKTVAQAMLNTSHKAETGVLIYESDLIRRMG